MTLEIFKGRKGTNNKLVLKSLYDNGYLSGWKLAREIAENDPRRRGKKKNWYHEAQKVYSVLVRKGGRLEELSNKEFIEKTDQGYRLTIYKGLCSALTLYENVKEPAIDELSKTYEIFPELKEAMEIISRLYPETLVEKYKVMLRTTKELLDQGWNFDRVTNKQFNKIFIPRFQENSLRELKEKRETGEKWEPNPELQELGLKLADRMKKILLEKVKEFEKEFDSFEKSTRKPRQQKMENEP